MTTYEPTNPNHIQHELFAEVSLVPTSVSQEKAWASPKKLGQVSFSSSCESFAWYDQTSSSWKTWQRSLITDWELYLENWPRQGMTVNGAAYLQVLWEPVIAGIDGGLSESLPTPTTMDHLPQRSPKALKRQMEGARKGRTKLASLREAVNPQTVELFKELQNLPTPTAREWKDGSSQSTKKCRKQDSLGRAIHHTYPPNGDHMYLNPFFVEEMMGYPRGWTDLGA